MFTCVVDSNGNNIGTDDVKWQQIRMSGGISTLSTYLTGGVTFTIITTISGDLLTSTLTITGVTDSNTVGTSLYRCVVYDIMSRSASIHVLLGKKYEMIYNVSSWRFGFLDKKKLPERNNFTIPS